MGLGILEDTHLPHVPGTARLTPGSGRVDIELATAGEWGETGTTAATKPKPDVGGEKELEGRFLGENMRFGEDGLKYDYSDENNPVLVVPQPADDPNDPLNWSLRKRDGITVVLCAISTVAATLSPILAANTIYLKYKQPDWNMDFTDVALLTGWHLLGVAVAGFFFVPTSRVWGKRHAYIIGTLILIASCAWGGAAQSYKSLVWARVFQGFAVAPFEALVNASVGDMYPVHQRGKRMAFTNFALYGGAFLTPVIVGKLTAVMGWRWVFYWVAIAGAVFLPLVIFCLPETAYRREINTDYSMTSPTASTLALSTPPPPSSNDSTTSPSKPPAIPPKQTYLTTLLPFSGRKTSDSLLPLILRPIPLLFHPAILWSMLTQGTLIGWTVLIGIDLAALYSTFPYLLPVSQIGYLYTGSFLGALLGFFLSGLLSDYSARVLTKLNHGIFEPEFRIILVIPQAVFGIMGVFGFGWTAEDVGRWGKVVPPMFFGLEVVGMILGATCSSLYLVDAHREIAVEGFTCLLLWKNLFSFALTWYGFDWLNEVGPWKMFWAAGIAQIAVCALSIPMWIFGKRNRSFFHRHNILKMLGLG